MYIVQFEGASILELRLIDYKLSCKNTFIYNRVSYKCQEFPLLTYIFKTVFVNFINLQDAKEALLFHYTLTNFRKTKTLQYFQVHNNNNKNNIKNNKKNGTLSTCCV